MTVQDVERLMEVPMFAVRTEALKRIIKFKKNDRESFLLKFLLLLAKESPEFFNDYTYTDMIVQDTFGMLFHRYAKDEIQEKTGASQKAVDVQFKRRIVELLPNHYDLNFPKNLPDEERRLFSAYLFLDQPEWFLAEEFLSQHQGESDWSHKIVSVYKRFHENPAYRFE